MLNLMLDFVEDKDKAIIYYLNANHISCNKTNWNNNEEYKMNLLNSVKYSKSMKFVYNRVKLAYISQKGEAQRYMKEARENIEEIETAKSINLKSVDYWLSSQRYVDEFILGIKLTESVYKLIFENK